MGGQLYSGMRPSLYLPGGFQDGLAHTHVGAAAAEVAAQPLLDFLVGGIRVAIKKGFGRHDESGRAVAALLPVVVDESFRDRVRLAARNTFDSHNVYALGVDGQNRAAIYGFSVEDHGAGAAGGPVADPLGAGQLQVVAQRIEQRDARLQVEVLRFAVDLERDGDRAGTHKPGLGRGRRQRLVVEQSGAQDAAPDAGVANESTPGDAALGFAGNRRIVL